MAEATPGMQACSGVRTFFRCVLTTLAATFVLTVAPAANAASCPASLQIAGMDPIPVTSFAFYGASSNPSLTPPAGARRIRVWLVWGDKSPVRLQEARGSGVNFSEAKLIVRKPTGAPDVTYTMNPLAVLMYSGWGPPEWNVLFGFQSVKVEKTPASRLAPPLTKVQPPKVLSATPQPVVTAHPNDPSCPQ